VVPAKTQAGGPVADVNEVLYESGLLEVDAPAAARTNAGEGECNRRGGIKLRLIGDDVAEVLSELSEIDFETSFEFVAAAMIGGASLQILFVESAVLKSDDGRGLGIGLEAVVSSRIMK